MIKYSDGHKGQAHISKEGNLEVKRRFNPSITLLCFSAELLNEKNEKSIFEVIFL